MKETTHSPLQKMIAIAMLLMILCVSAFATPTALSTQVLVQNNIQVTAGQLAIAFSACDNVNGNSFTITGREILIIQNTDASPHTFTVTPVTDPYGGQNSTLTGYSLAASGSAGSTSAIQMKYLQGWTSGSSVSLACNSNLVKYALLQYN